MKIRVLSVLLLLGPSFHCPSVSGSPAITNQNQATDEIVLIRRHYTEINAQSARYRKVRKKLSGFSTEGGELVAYFARDAIMKMAATFYGETGRSTEEYNYWNGKLIFVLRSESTYNKPLSGKIVRTTRNRLYFHDDALIKWLDENNKPVATDAAEFQEKQKAYLETSGQLLEGARSRKSEIENDQ